MFYPSIKPWSLWYECRYIAPGIVEYWFYTSAFGADAGLMIELGVCSDGEMFQRFDYLIEATQRPVS